MAIHPVPFCNPVLNFMSVGTQYSFCLGTPVTNFMRLAAVNSKPVVYLSFVNGGQSNLKFQPI